MTQPTPEFRRAEDRFAEFRFWKCAGRMRRWVGLATWLKRLFSRGCDASAFGSAGTSANGPDNHLLQRTISGRGSNDAVPSGAAPCTLIETGQRRSPLIKNVIGPAGVQAVSTRRLSKFVSFDLLGSCNRTRRQ